MTLTADRIEYDTETKVVTAEGNVRASRGDVVITADHLVGDLSVPEIEATGNVTLKQDRQTATGTALRYNFRTRTGRMEQVVAKYGPWNLSSRSLETAQGQGVATDALVTPCDPKHPFFHVTARRVVIVPDDHLTAYDASLYVYGVRVITLPSYTASLRPEERGKRKGGLSFGYTTLDGLYVEYRHFFLVGTADDLLRVRYGTATSFTVEDILSQRGPDHLWSLHLGRDETYDLNGNLINLDHYSVGLAYDPKQISTWPVTYAIQGDVGSYSEVSTGVSTLRADALLNLATDTVVLSPSMIGGASAQVRYDVYGTGQQRTVLRTSEAATDLLNAHNVVTLSYNATSVTGSTPFLFDSIIPDSAVSLAYNYIGSGFLLGFGTSVTYDFQSAQTSLGGTVTLGVSPSVVLNVSASYNLTLQQWTEVDYALNARCDCVTVNLVYRTFPQIPAQNQLVVSVNLSTLLEAGGGY